MRDASRSLSHLRYGVLVSTVVFALVGNLLAPAVFRDVRPSDFLMSCASFMASGGLAAEVCLLAIWAALGPQAVVVRLPMTSALLIVAVCAYVVGLQIPGSRMPMEVAVVIGAFAVVMFFAVQLPLWFVRVVKNRQIDLPDAARRIHAHHSLQFGLRQLMACTAGVAILLVMIRRSLPSAALNANMIAADSARITIVILLFVTFAVLVCLPCVRLALGEKHSVAALGWLLVVFFLGPPTMRAAMSAVFGYSPDSTEELLMLYSFSSGLTMTVLLSLFATRLLGFRLVRPP